VLDKVGETVNVVVVGAAATVVGRRVDASERAA
jgi:hypothetical protein